MQTQQNVFLPTLQRLLNERVPAGHFEGCLSSSALSTATAISALSFYLKRKSLPDERQQEIQSAITASMGWMLAQQNNDGGFGDTNKNYSNISTTMLVVAAVTAADAVEEFSDQMAKAEVYIADQGGIEGLRKRYGTDKTFAVPILANCAMAGIVPWKEVSALPFEAACVPQRFYNLMRLPVVSYAIPALVAIGQCKFINDPPWDPVRKIIRRLSIGRALKVLDKMQPASGGYLEAIPLTSFVAMALIESGRCDHDVVENSVRFLLDSMRTIDDDTNADQATWPIDTNLATWGTTLAINGISADARTFEDVVIADSLRWHACFHWLLSCQNRTVHPFTGAAPGGWGWTDLSGAVPDADDTPGALIALRRILTLVQSESFTNRLPEQQRALFGATFQRRIILAVVLGLKWLVDLQNRDGGWPTFCKGWGALPFDRSGSDLTAHAIRALHAWKNEPLMKSDDVLVSAKRIQKSIDRGFRYLNKNQSKEGFWLPLWFGNQDFPDDTNPCYGTAKVAAAYAEVGLIDTAEAQRGLDWMMNSQNPDGGFGGGPSVQWKNVSLGNSTVEESALCTEALLYSNDARHRNAAMDGLRWLSLAVEADAIATYHPIGFYFAKLWYHERLYPLLFSVAAMARKRSLER